MQNVTIEFLCLDILNKRDWRKLKNFDIIFSNPPYITKSESEKMSPNILQYEPQNALFVEDNDALLYYRHIMKFGLEKLNKSGKIYLEKNEKKGKELEFLFIKNGLDKVNLCKDINSKNRMLRCQIK